MNNWIWRKWLLVLGSIILGLVLIVIANYLPTGLPRQLVEQMGPIFLVAGTWSGIYELYLRKEFQSVYERALSVVEGKFNLASEAALCGLVGISNRVSRYDFREILSEKGSVRILMNDGRTWVSSNSELLRSRFSEVRQPTMFVFLDPNGLMLQVLAQKLDVTREEIKQKVLYTINELRRIHKAAGARSELKIYIHGSFNPYSLYASDGMAVVVPYFASPARVGGRRDSPALVFRATSMEGSYHSRLLADIDALIGSAIEVGVEGVLVAG